MKPLHTDDIVAGDGQIVRQQMIDNFKAIEQEDIDDDNARDQLNERVTKIENLLKTYGMTEEGTK